MTEAWFICPLKLQPRTITKRVLTNYVDIFLSRLTPDQSLLESTSDGRIDILTLATGQGVRYVAMADYDEQIRADKGTWAAITCGINFAVVKVVADDKTLLTIEENLDFLRLPDKGLDVLMVDIPDKQADAINAKLKEMGYLQSEIDEKLGGDVKNRTLRDVLTVATTWQVVMAYDKTTDSLIVTGELLPASGNIDELDTVVR